MAGLVCCIRSGFMTHGSGEGRSHDGPLPGASSQQLWSHGMAGANIGGGEGEGGHMAGLCRVQSTGVVTW